MLGYTAPRTEQVQAVEKFVSGCDVFVSLPTGGGKSLCYACLPLVYDTLKRVQQQSIVIVVSPLNTLMQDQVASFMASRVYSRRWRRCCNKCVKRGGTVGVCKP